MPIETVTPPAPKAVEPAPAPEPTPTPVPEPTPTPAAPATEKKGMKGALDRLKSVAEGKGDPAKVESKEPASKEQSKLKADEKPLPSGDKELDAEIEKVAKDLSPAQKKAFTHKTYELRDMKRKLADAEAKGKNTESLEVKVKELEDRLAAGPKESVDPKIVEDYQAQIKTAQERADALAKELEIAAVERTEEFKRAVTQPKKVIEDRIAELAKKYEIAPKVLLNAVYGSSDDQVEATEKLSEPEKIKFYNDALRITELDERAETLRTNAAEANVKIAAKREAETKTQREQSARVFAETHKQNWKALTEQLPIFSPVEGDDDVSKNWNTHIEKAQKWSGETDFIALDAEQQSNVLQRASVFPMLVGALQSKEGAVTKLTAELATANEALGKFRANKADGEATPKEEITPPAKPQGRMAERIGAKIAQSGR